MKVRFSHLLLVAALGVGLPLVACSAEPSGTAAPATIVAPSATTVSPATSTTVEQESSGAADISSLLGLEVEQWMAKTGAPGLTMAVILPDGTEITQGFGVSDLRSDSAVEPSDFWRFASITKPMTSAVVLLLAEQGLLDLDEPVASYLGSDWAKGYVDQGIDYGPLLTVRQLLNHTNGFAEYAFDPGFFFLAGSRLEKPFDPEEIVGWAVDRGPLFTPGTGYNYNTVGHVAAGLVIEAVSGKSAHELFRDLLFDPVGAQQIFLPPKEFPPQMVASGYVSGELLLAFSFLPALAPLIPDARIGDFLEITALPQELLTSAPFTGGGIEAQAIEIARVMRSIFSGQLLTPASLTEFAELVPGQDYGLGINVADVDGVRVFSHGGGVPGFRSHALTIPDIDVSLAISTNLIPVDPDIGVLADALLAVLRTHL